MNSPRSAEDASQPQRSNFFRLPREVRDQILFHFCGDKLVFIDKKIPPLDGDATVSSGNRKQPLPYVKARGFLCGLQISHQFYEEAAEMFYSSSKFMFDDIVPF